MMSEDEAKVSEGQVIDRPRTFPRFDDLPQELKDKIWDFAVRIDVPGLHFFATTFRKDPDQEDDRIRSADKVEIFPYWRGAGFYQLSIPTEKPGNFPHNDRDPSAYSIDDKALWHACHDSRRALQRSIGCSHPDRLRCQQCDLERSMLRTCYYVDSNGSKRYFSVKQHDVVCFQPLSWHDIGFERNGAAVSLVDQLGYVNVALSFDPNWKMPTIEDFSEWNQSAKLPIYSQAAHNLDHLWFIDFRIRRRDQRAGLVREDRQSFYGNGCRLVEVRLYDHDFEFEDGSPLDPVDRLVDCSQARPTISRDSNPFTFNYRWQLASKAEILRPIFDRPKTFKRLRRSWTSLKDTDTDRCWELGWLRLHVLAFELC